MAIAPAPIKKPNAYVIATNSEARKKYAKQLAAQKTAAQESADAKYRERRLEEVTSARDKDLAAGRKRGEEVFGEGSLGRVSAERSADIADVVAKRKAELSGMAPEEETLLRDQALSRINQGSQTALRRLRAEQGASGVRGPLAASQAARILTDAGSQKAQLESDLLGKKLDLRRQALDKLETTLRGTEGDELARQRFNLEQGGKEKLGQLGAEFGYGQLGAAERGAIAQELIAKRSAEAADKRMEEENSK